MSSSSQIQPDIEINSGSNSSNIPQGLKWEDVSISVTVGRGKKAVKKQILHGVSGNANRGEMTAILGPSGSGKTTLANVLTGRLGQGKYELSGNVTFEGEKRRPDIWKSTTAYVEQEDLMYDCLTVEETIIFSAMLRLPSSYTKAQKIERAKAVIDILGLSHVKDTAVGSSTRRGISGGERKRCSVGVELVTSPKLMFLDEPTSGLDSHSAYKVISTVKEVARQGVAVMVTIHQPAYELFAMFDKVLLIAQGRIAFHGTIPEAIDHFSGLGYPVPPGANAADHFISLITETASANEEGEKNKVANILDAWATEQEVLRKNAVDPNSVVLENSSLKVPKFSNDLDFAPGFALGFFEELWWLSRRGWLQAARDRNTLLAPFISSTFVGLILAFTFFRLGDGQSDVIGKSGLLFFLPVNISFGVLFPIITYLPLLNGILTRERSTGAYRVSTFYLSRYTIEIPLAILSRLVEFILIYWVCGFRQEAGSFFIFLGINCLTVVFSVAMGLFIGSTSKDLAVVQATTPALNVVFMLFGGFLLPWGAVPKWFIWLYWISYLRYVFASLCINEFEGRTLDCTEGSCYRTGDDFLDAYDLTAFSIGVNAAFLAALVTVFGVMAYLMLRRLTNPRLRLDV